eukprot:Em0015g417a
MSDRTLEYQRLKETLNSYNGLGAPGLSVSKQDTAAEGAVYIVKNDSDNNYTLGMWAFVIPDSAVEVQLSPTLPLLVAKGSEASIAVKISGAFQVYKNDLVFDFGSDIKYCCDIEVTKTTETTQLLLPNGEFKSKEKKFDYQNKISNAENGVKPRMFKHGQLVKTFRVKITLGLEMVPLVKIILGPEMVPLVKIVLGLEMVPLVNLMLGMEVVPLVSIMSGVEIPGNPYIVRGDIRRRPRTCLPSLAEPLTMENYSDHFHKLLWLDEMKREGNIREHDMSSVTLVEDGVYLCLDVPELAKRKVEVVVGDKLIFSDLEVPSEEPAPEGEGAQQEAAPAFVRRAKNYIGYVHQISGEQLKLKFKHTFHESRLLWGKKHDVMFTVNRGPLMRMHKALENVQRVGETILFPNVRPPSLPSRESLQFINTELNPQQRRAVEAIVSGACRPIPYILFGPPGTGKTVTVVESILQVYKLNTLCKILACTPSNSAADLLAERLHSSGQIEESSMIRLNAFMRTQALPSSIKNFSIVANKKAKSKAKSSRIVICTCSTAAILRAFKIKFSYVFVDEGGQALEPECLIPVSLLDEGCGQLVLAGDPLQLGPVVFCSLASDNGLSISMLERLMGRDLYKRNTTAFAATGNYDSMVVTKLVENYRSHGALLKLYSDQFYDGELMERADHEITHRLCTWECLPTKEVPLIFHGIQGKEFRERGSPSWFNPFEAEQVLIYTKALVQKRLVLETDIGIISPYNKQVEKIRFLLDRERLRDVKVGSVEEFQGRENLVIIISTVRSSDDIFIEDMRKQVGFVSNPKRFNVAISRAQALLIVVGNPHLLAQATQNGTLPGQVPGQPPPPPTAGQAPPTAGQAPPTAGQAPPTAGQAPPTAGQAPPTAGQVPPTAEQAPPTAGQAPPTAGQSSCWNSLIQFARDHGCYTGCPLPTV